MGGTNKCPICSATFTRSQHVARHMRSHTGDRPYPCPWCPEKFARSDLLARHKKKFHPDGPNSAPPPPKYSRQPKTATASGSAVAASTSKGKGRADPAGNAGEPNTTKLQIPPLNSQPGGPVSAPPAGYQFPVGAQGSSFSYEGGIPRRESQPHFSQIAPGFPHPQQLPPGHHAQMYDRRFSLPGHLTGGPLPSALYANVSSGDSSTSSSEFEHTMQGRSSSAYVNGLIGITDSPSGLSPADSGSSFTPASALPRRQIPSTSGPQQQVSQQQWYSSPYNPTFQPSSMLQAQQQQQQQQQLLQEQQNQQRYPPQQQQPNSLLPPGQMGNPTYDGGSAAYVPHLAGLSNDNLLARSPLGMMGWNGSEWASQDYNPDSRPRTSFMPGPSASSSAYPPKPDAYPLQPSSSFNDPQKIPSLEDVKDIWRYFLSPPLPTPAAQPFVGLSASDRANPTTTFPQTIPGGGGPTMGSTEPGGQGRSFEEAVRDRPTFQLQAPSSVQQRKYEPDYLSTDPYGQPQQQQQQPEQSTFSHQPMQPYHATWPPTHIPAAEARKMLPSAVKREFSSVDMGSPSSGSAYPAQQARFGGQGGRPKMPRLRSGSVGRVPEGFVWEGFLEGYRGAAGGVGGGVGEIPPSA